MTIWSIWWLALGIKIALVPFIPITPDETYYFMWARHPALSYFDHPPFVAWIMMLALPLWKTFLGVRLPGVIFSHLGYIPWFGILKRLGFSNEAMRLWILGLLLGPLTGLGAFLITPDVPLVVFWSTGILALLWTLENPTSMRWIIFGITFGLGMLSKYVMVIFVPAMILWLIWEKKWRELLKPGPWLGLLASLIVFAPVLIWNFQHDFASFAFQTKHGLANNGFQWNWSLEYLGSQLGLLNPLVAVIGIYVILKRGRDNKLLTVFSLTPLIFFLLTSFRARVEANWPVCAYPSFVALAVVATDAFKNNKKWRVALKASFAACFLFIGAVISHTIKPWLPIDKDRDHTEITREWLADIPLVQNYKPLFGRSYQMAAYHSYFRKAEDEVFKPKGLDRTDVYDFLPQSSEYKSGYIIMKADDPFPANLGAGFDRETVMILPSRMVLYKLSLVK